MENIMQALRPQVVSKNWHRHATCTPATRAELGLRIALLEQPSEINAALGQVKGRHHFKALDGLTLLIASLRRLVAPMASITIPFFGAPSGAAGVELH